MTEVRNCKNSFYLEDFMMSNFKENMRGQWGWVAAEIVAGAAYVAIGLLAATVGIPASLAVMPYLFAAAGMMLGALVLHGVAAYSGSRWLHTAARALATVAHVPVVVSPAPIFITAAAGAAELVSAVAFGVPLMRNFPKAEPAG
jgi:hypothetical protein